MAFDKGTADKNNMAAFILSNVYTKLSTVYTELSNVEMECSNVDTWSQLQDKIEVKYCVCCTTVYTIEFDTQK
jgi:hypothetical protein